MTFNIFPYLPAFGLVYLAASFGITWYYINTHLILGKTKGGKIINVGGGLKSILGVERRILEPGRHLFKLSIVAAFLVPLACALAGVFILLERHVSKTEGFGFWMKKRFWKKKE